MKKLLRHPATQVALGWVLHAYMVLVRRTVRWRHENIECVDGVLASDQGALALCWHGRIPVALAVAKVWWRKPRACLVSPSGDGEFFAQAMAHARFPSIRASSAKKGDSVKARALVAAFREAVKFVTGGGVLIVTPDGPRGPSEVMAPGAAQIARRTGAPVFMMGIAVSPASRAGSWDRAMIGRPFGKGAVVWDGPFHAPADADDATMEALIADWSARLSALTRRAEVLAGYVDPLAAR
ncbi:lysophospholipid acyltransferase family protein [Phenylobacterium sp.]|uniref:lysophospholipid acyltransferase family protein n=1 Tax=Phenylobacterium sp. TaxID=1871053 RepID=UPI002735EDDF|nr:lysophospholipid acyltransferase family protein [Phenylobacterium sp.]MDP3856052.1 lysophospholipid acyltransferase family protein [Phenylobacterium sp.]